MISKEHVENFLKLNGIPPTAADEEIRSALITARWHKDDVEVALLMLRGKKGGEEEDSEIIAARQLFRSDMRVAPETLSSLLGVDVKMNADRISAVYQKQATIRTSALSIAFFTLFALIIVFAAALGFMYAMHIGPFYVPVEQFTF